MIFINDYSDLLFSYFTFPLLLSAEAQFHLETRNNQKRFSMSSRHCICPPMSIYAFSLTLLSCYYGWILLASRKHDPHPSLPQFRTLLQPSANLSTSRSISPFPLDHFHQHINNLLFLPLKKEIKNKQIKLSPLLLSNPRPLQWLVHFYLCLTGKLESDVLIPFQLLISSHFLLNQTSSPCPNQSTRVVLAKATSDLHAT